MSWQYVYSYKLVVKKGCQFFRDLETPEYDQLTGRLITCLR